MPTNNRQQGPIRPSSRSLVGMLLLIGGLGAYAFLVAALGDLLISMPLAIQVIYYLVAGIIWILPVRRLLQWMADGYKK